MKGCSPASLLSLLRLGTVSNALRDGTSETLQLWRLKTICIYICINCAQARHETWNMTMVKWVKFLKLSPRLTRSEKGGCSTSSLDFGRESVVDPSSYHSILETQLVSPQSTMIPLLLFRSIQKELSCDDDKAFWLGFRSASISRTATESRPLRAVWRFLDHVTPPPTDQPPKSKLIKKSKAQNHEQQSITIASRQVKQQYRQQ